MKKYILYSVLWLTNLVVNFMTIKKDKITFISYKTDKLEGNFKLISKELTKLKKYNQCFILMKYNHSIFGDLKYLINCIRQVYHINTSRLVVLDYNNFVVSNFKRKGVKVLQVWHASGAIKKFGNDINREYKIMGYDYIISNSDQWKNHYSTAFGVEEENVIATGIPKTDNIFSVKIMKKYRAEMLEKHPQIKGKKIVLYAPTFRGDVKRDYTYIDINLNHLETRLGLDYVIIYKMHPWLSDKIISYNRQVINANNESITKLFSVTDYLVTDYSSILFDFSILNKPIISYVPDIKEYSINPGMYFQYEKDIPTVICKTEEDIIDTIVENKFDYHKIKEFKNKYFKYKDGKSTKRVVDVINTIMNDNNVN